MIDDDVVAETAEMFGAYKQQMFPADWKDLCAENRDLRIAKGTLMTRAELAEDPLLTVVISDMLPAKDAAAVVDAYYRQKLPAFEMRAAEKFRGLLEERYGTLPNFGFIDSSAGIKKFKTSALKNAAGRYIIFVDEGIVPSRRIIKHMELLSCADCFVTDYSAMIYEAAIAGVPVYMYAFDKSSYGSKRGFYIDPEKDLPWKMHDTAEKVITAVKNAECDMDAQQRFADRYVDARGGCTAELAETILSMI